MVMFQAEAVRPPQAVVQPQPQPAVAGGGAAAGGGSR